MILHALTDVNYMPRKPAARIPKSAELGYNAKAAENDAPEGFWESGSEGSKRPIGASCAGGVSEAVRNAGQKTFTLIPANR